MINAINTEISSDLRHWFWKMPNICVSRESKKCFEFISILGNNSNTLFVVDKCQDDNRKITVFYHKIQKGTLLQLL